MKPESRSAFKITTVAPDVVRTVRTYATRAGYGPS
jgi:hypothetical protein